MKYNIKEHKIDLKVNIHNVKYYKDFLIMNFGY